jgi:hypothetical protein
MADILVVINELGVIHDTLFYWLLVYFPLNSFTWVSGGYLSSARWLYLARILPLGIPHVSCSTPYHINLFHRYLILQGLAVMVDVVRP